MHDTITKYEDGIWQVKVPLPFPLQWVNAYVIIGGEGGITLIDPGLHTSAGVDRWEEARRKIGFQWSDVVSIVLTHHHPDHYGLAGWMQERTGAPVLMSDEAWHQARMLWSEEMTASTSSALLAMFAAHGLPRDKHAAMREHLDSFIPLVSPQPAGIRAVSYGERVLLGDTIYEAIHTPGHASGHLSFYHAESGRLFCGDHVLPRISPNVSLLPFGDEDPLGTYLDSLRQAQRLPVKLAFPGHRDPFPHYNERVGAILEHHQERLEQIRTLMAEPRTGYEVCLALFGDQLSMHQLRFALSETLAHLVYLELRGIVKRVESADSTTFVSV